MCRLGGPFSLQQGYTDCVVTSLNHYAICSCWRCCSVSHIVRAIPLPGPQNLWSRSLRDLDHRFESSRVRGALRACWKWRCFSGWVSLIINRHHAIWNFSLQCIHSFIWGHLLLSEKKYVKAFFLAGPTLGLLKPMVKVPQGPWPKVLSNM